MYKIEDEKSLEERARILFLKHFSSSPEVMVVAPGRVNLIGEHTDYNCGFVLPMALPMVTMVMGGVCEGTLSKVVTDNEDCDEPRTFQFDSSSDERYELGKPRWGNYLKGVLALHPNKDDIPAFKAVVVSSLPSGSGLSSSAALEISFFRFVDELMGISRKNEEDLKEMALLCQKVEHTYALVPCGIMDQLVCSIASQKQAVLIDCRSLDIKQISLTSDEVTLLIINSNVKHVLSSSQYPVRKEQCEQACKELGVDSLRDVTVEELEENVSLLDEVCLKRARHVVTENRRCLQMATCLQEGSFEEAGRLMLLSHASLRDDYDVSCLELDFLVTMVTQMEGVYGSRMTGGGFGGCTVTLLKRCAVDATIQHVQKEYEGVASFYKCGLKSKE